MINNKKTIFINDFLKTLFKTNNIIPTEVQEKVGATNLNKNILILSSCGSGKTEASYYISSMWGGKTLYAFPMKSLASSIRGRLDTYEDILNTGGAWNIQHSGESEDIFLKGNKVVTTIDQVLSGYIGIGRQAFIKGKNVVMSNFIFDEIQLFDPGITLKTLIYMLDSIKDNGNKFVIMTATMPQLLIDFLGKRYDMEIVITEKPSIEDRKVKLKYTKEINYKSIEIFDKKQILICNTQKEQEDVLNNIKDKDRVIALNNKLLQSDRQKVEEKVFKYFGKNTPENNKILIATQIIEAGMDISATKMYSSLAPIDCLIQREGRVCRWGGDGEFIVFKGFYHVYDEGVCISTLEKIKENDEKIFTWSLQKELVNNILNPFYEGHLKELNKFRATMKSGNRDKLIRYIENVNIIVSDTCEKNDFKRESISISRSSLKKLSEKNILYVSEKNRVKEVSEKDVDNGDRVIIQGNDCIYDILGFRYEEGKKTHQFPISNSSSKKIDFEDYIEEPWIEHGLEVKKIMEQTLLEEKFKPWSKEEIEKYSIVAGLHDLGKLTKAWQKYISSKGEPLAHNVFIPRNNELIKDIKHEYVSTVALRERLNKLELNIILNHHGRVMLHKTTKKVSEYEFIYQYEDLLKQLGFQDKIDKKNVIYKNITEKQLITPIDEKWVDLLYLEGTFMESEIKAIKMVKARKLNQQSY